VVAEDCGAPADACSTWTCTTAGLCESIEVCDDGDRCTADTCDRSGSPVCVHEIVDDADRDGFPASVTEACALPLDCEPNDPRAYPVVAGDPRLLLGPEERDDPTDFLDNDCDGATDRCVEYVCDGSVSLVAHRPALPVTDPLDGTCCLFAGFEHTCVATLVANPVAPTSCL
jgi:hypothetical protein